MIWFRKTRRLEKRVKELETQQTHALKRLKRIEHAAHVTGERAFKQGQHMTGDVLWAIATDVALLIHEIEGE